MGDGVPSTISDFVCTHHLTARRASQWILTQLAIVYQATTLFVSIPRYRTLAAENPLLQHLAQGTLAVLGKPTRPVPPDWRILQERQRAIVTHDDIPSVLIIDEEWPDVSVERDILRESLPEVNVTHCHYDFRDVETGQVVDLADFTGVLAQVYATLNAKHIAKLHQCHGIAVMGGGFDRIDIDAATAAGIPVTNVQGYCAEDLAQYVVTNALTQLKPTVTATPTTPWGLQAYAALPERIVGKTMFIVGLGRIGTVVANRALGLGLRVIAHDPNVDDVTMRTLGVEPVAWDDGFLRADIVSVHVNLTPQTRHLIGRKEFSLMASHAVLINTARGAILDETALVTALEDGWIAHAVLDVVEHEPPTFAEPIFQAPRTTITPHVSYLSADSITELRSRSTTNLLHMMHGNIPSDCVNFTVDAPLGAR